MKTLKSIFFGVVLFFLFAAGATAQVPRLLNYQGKLTNPDGVAVPDGAYSVGFRLYSAPAGGVLYWLENQSVTVRDGVFNVILGGTSPLPTFEQQFYLELQVGIDPPLPRHQLTASPYAFTAASATTVSNNAITSAKIQDLQVTRNDLGSNSVASDKILDGEVRTADIADGTVTPRKMKANIASEVSRQNNVADDPAAILVKEIVLDAPSCVLVVGHFYFLASAARIASSSSGLQIYGTIQIDGFDQGFNSQVGWSKYQYPNEVSFSNAVGHLATDNLRCLGAGLHTVTLMAWWDAFNMKNVGVTVQTSNLHAIAIGSQ